MSSATGLARRRAHDGAPAGGSGIAARAAIDVDDVRRSGGHAGSLGTKYRIRWQLSHGTMPSFRRIC